MSDGDASDSGDDGADDADAGETPAEVNIVQQHLAPAPERPPAEIASPVDDQASGYIVRDALTPNERQQFTEGEQPSEQDTPEARGPRQLTDQEAEQLRLVLSTYQDGSGEERAGPHGETLPGWRNFETATAEALNGEPPAGKKKGALDVLARDAETGERFGVSCKTSAELDTIDETGRVSVILRTAPSAFWKALESQGITEQNYRSFPPDQIGAILTESVRAWYRQDEEARGISHERSSLLVLSSNDEGQYQLHQFPLDLPDPSQLEWSLQGKRIQGIERTTGATVLELADETPDTGEAVAGTESDGDTLFAWYTKGGQLFYYPRVETAVWHSEVFELEPLPPEVKVLTPAEKAAQYFPEQWQRTQGTAGQNDGQ